jgi:hypothetical protein
MSDASSAARSLRERFSGTTEERLGKALSDLLENPLLSGAISRAFDARERAAQAQEVAMGALNIPSAADIERLTRRLRSVSHRLEGIEDGVQRLDRALSPGGVEARLSAIEDKLGALTERLGQEPPGPPSAERPDAPSKGSASAGKHAAPAGKRSASSGKRSASSGPGKAKTKKA